MKELIKHLNDIYPDLHKTYSTSECWINLTFPDMHFVIFKGNEIYRLDFKQKLAILWLEHNKKADYSKRLKKTSAKDYFVVPKRCIFESYI